MSLKKFKVYWNTELKGFDVCQYVIDVDAVYEGFLQQCILMAEQLNKARNHTIIELDNQ